MTARVEAAVLEVRAAEPGRRPWPEERPDVLGAMGCDGDDAFELIEALRWKFEDDLGGYPWPFQHTDETSLPTWAAV